jgi:lipid-A-disaccharide synthase-like uncharacterized protein
MASLQRQTGQDARQPPRGASAAEVALLLAGLTAAWLTAGSTGMLAHPLRHVLTWLALGAAAAVAWPADFRRFDRWGVLLCGAILAAVLTAADSPFVNILAAAAFMAALAQVNRGAPARMALLAAFSILAFACYRLVCDFSPPLWHLAGAMGHGLGLVAGWLSGRPLDVGATFGGVDFLVLSAAACIGWLVCSTRPRKIKALVAFTAILVGHVVYLVILAHWDAILAILPETPAALSPGENHIGTWTISNGLRSMLPWNLPLAALAIHAAVLGVIFHRGQWPPVVELDPLELKRWQLRDEKEELSGKAILWDMLLKVGPALLAVAAAMLCTLAPVRCDLRGKTVVALRPCRGDWLKPQYDSAFDGDYGLLPLLVESLGGRMLLSDELSAQDLAKADVLLLVHPDRPWKPDALERIWAFVRGGGSLLLAAEPAYQQGDRRSSFDELLDPRGVEVNFDVAVPRAADWEQSISTFAHPAAIGLDDRRNVFGIQAASSLRLPWTARPILVGRWCWSEPGSDAVDPAARHCDPGERLGDLPLAAEWPLERGRVAVLGDAAPLHNRMIARSYQFIGRLLSVLAQPTSGPQTPWRQLAALAALAGMAALLLARPTAWQLMLVPAVLAAALWAATATVGRQSRPLPDAGGKEASNVAYIDAAHLGAYADDPDAELGLGELLRVLACDGYLPLMAPDLSAERLRGGGLLISIAPGRAYSPAERAAATKFMEDGGVFICLAGAEDSRPGNKMLAEFGMKTPPTPVPPGDESREPEPLGSVSGRTVDERLQPRFYALWPLEVDENTTKRWVYWVQDGEDWTVVCSRAVGGGVCVLIGDTHFAANENLAPYAEGVEAENVRFWRWLLSRVVPGRKSWTPPPRTAAEKAAIARAAAESEDEEEADEEEQP